MEFVCIFLFAFDLWLSVCTTADVSSSHCRVIFYIHTYTRICIVFFLLFTDSSVLVTDSHRVEPFGRPGLYEVAFGENVNVRACAPIHTSRQGKCFFFKLSVELCVSGGSVVVGGWHAAGSGPYRM